MIALFNDVALGVCGGWRGGPAQVCVMSSALMGTISGSGIANVVASGQFTIPLMKRFGFRAAFAGGVEATSSMGGQIMPPVMGAVAFIMAETLNIPYAEVVKAAIIPAILYFGACFWMVYIESGKFGLAGMSRAELPNPWHAVRDHWPLMLPLGGARLSALRRLHPDLRRHHGARADRRPHPRDAARGAASGRFAFRLVFWVALGARRRLLPALGRRHPRAGHRRAGRRLRALPRRARDACASASTALAEGAKNALPVGIACAIVGIVIGTLTLTGIASTFIGAIIAIGETNLFLSLVLTMITCLILGMGIPTIPNYIITSSIAGPGAARARRAARRQPHVRLLLRHHGRPDAAGGARRLRRGADGQGLGHDDRAAGDQARRRRLRGAVHGGLHARR